MFRFNANVRPQVERIVSVMQWANGNQYASQTDVYGSMSKALDLIVVRECGQEVLNTIEHSRNHWNFGGNESWLIDVEVAVDDALQELAAKPQPVRTVVDTMREINVLRNTEGPRATDRIAELCNRIAITFAPNELAPAQRQLRGNIRNLCCGMTDEEQIDYFIREREAGRNFVADCVLEFFTSTTW